MRGKYIMAFEHYIRSGQKKLRCGYTTGTCAVLAAKAAFSAILESCAPKTVSVVTPKGLEVEVEVYRSEILEPYKRAKCSVLKDAGDDIDVTDGAEIAAEVSLTKTGEIIIDGGEGVGRVTKSGLDQPVGNAAINSGPRSQIKAVLEELCEDSGYTGGVKVIISIPEGRKLAAQTFNPLIGIEGGISVIGTSGIVEPMSESALIDTIEISIRQARETSDRLIITPGNYGENFIEKFGYRELGVPTVVCSNFIGETLDMLALHNFRQVLLIGHIGKFCKLAAGIMNTHSKYADGRAEVFCAHAAVCGTTKEVARELMEAATSDAAIELLKKEAVYSEVISSMAEAMQFHINKRIKGKYEAGVIVFSNVYGELARTKPAEKILTEW